MICCVSHYKGRLQWVSTLCIAIVFVGLTLVGVAADKEILPDFLVRTWDSEDGLPAAPIQAAARTADGYLWVATRAGLARFDGVRFVIFTTNNTPALQDDRISCLLVDSAGDLWAGTEAGTLAIRRQGAFVRVPTSVQLRGKRINSLAQDGKGALWIATEGEGLMQLHDGICSFFSGANGLPSDVIRQVVADGKGQPWAIGGGKLAFFDGVRWEPQVVPGLEGSTVAALAKSQDGGLWVATTCRQQMREQGGQVLKLREGQWRSELPPYPWPHVNLAPRVTALLEYQADSVWVGTFAAGLVHWGTGQKWEELTAEGLHRQIIVNCLAADETGSLWVGYGRSDQLQQVRCRLVKTMRMPVPGAQSRVLTVCAARDQSVWIGTSDAGVFHCRDGQFEPYGAEQGVLDMHVRVMLEDSHTNFWVGTWGGLLQLKGKRFERVNTPDALRSRITALCEDHAGHLWVGATPGLVRLGADGGRVFGRSEGIAEAQINAIEEDRYGVIWVAMGGQGLFRQAGPRFTRCDAIQWSGLANIRALHADAAGALWGTTDKGLFRLKEGKFAHWSTAEGLPSELLRAIIEDASGNLWISSDNGFFGCSTGQFDNYVQGKSPPLLFWHLSTADGLDSRMSSGGGQPAAARSTDGRLWFPNQYALAVFDPATLFSAMSVQPVRLEEVLVDGVPCAREPAGGLRVKSSARRFEFHYTSPTLQAPERLQFRFRLRGLESDWVNAGAQRVAYYSHLAPGGYEFQVMVGGPDGFWREAKPGLRLEVVPLWWERRLVHIFAGLALVASLVGAARVFERGKLRRQMQELETQRALEKERRRIAQDLHDDIGARLTRINLQGELAGRASLPPGELRRQVAGMTGKVLELIVAMDEIVWAINPRHDSVPSLASYLQHFAAEFFEPSSIRCRVDVEPGLPKALLGAQVRHNLFLAVKEALHNAAKHSNAREVWLKVRCLERTLVITVDDDGQGFDAAQTNGRRSGLANMHARLQDAGGDCIIESQQGEGCHVRFVLPL